MRRLVLYGFLALVSAFAIRNGMTLELIRPLTVYYQYRKGISEMNMEILKFLLWMEIGLAIAVLALGAIRAFGSYDARYRLHKVADAIMHPLRIFT